MYFVMAGLLAWYAIDGASCECSGLIRRREVVKTVVGRGESGVVVVAINGSACASVCVFITTGCAGVGCAAIVPDARTELDEFCIWQTYSTASVY